MREIPERRATHPGLVLKAAAARTFVEADELTYCPSRFRGLFGKDEIKSSTSAGLDLTSTHLKINSSRLVVPLLPIGGGRSNS